MSYHPHLAHRLPTALFQPSLNSFATNHLNIHNGRGLTLCPCYTPSWPYIIVCPQATSEFIQEHIAIRKYSFIALHYDGPTSLVYTCDICMQEYYLVYMFTACATTRELENSVIHVNCTYNQQQWHIFYLVIMNGACKLF